MKSIFRNLLILIALAAVAGLLVWGYVAGRSDDADDDAPVQAPPRTSQVNGRTVLKFDEQAQRANGIVVTALKPSRRSTIQSAAATVLDVQPLLDLKLKYTAAQTTLAQALAASTASESEYKRLIGLNRQGDNVSQKSIESAQAANLTDAATLDSARQSLALLQESTEMHWSPVVASWFAKISPQLDALLARRIYLLQVTATNPGGWSAPAEATIELPSGSHVLAHRITSLPQVDPRLQAPSYLYSVPADPGIVPGLNLAVSLPAGPLQGGTIVPQSAVVWSQGQSWIYVEATPGQFGRERISTDNPVTGGWFVTGEPGPGTRVVTSGAETLFAEEFRSQIQADED